MDYPQRKKERKKETVIAICSDNIMALFGLDQIVFKCYKL
jgi:hypothetical protein